MSSSNAWKWNVKGGNYQCPRVTTHRKKADHQLTLGFGKGHQLQLSAYRWILACPYPLRLLLRSQLLGFGPWSALFFQITENQNKAPGFPWWCLFCGKGGKGGRCEEVWIYYGIKSSSYVKWSDSFGFGHRGYRGLLSLRLNIYIINRTVNIFS